MEKLMKKQDENSIRKNFPILEEKIGKYPLIYLDNAATMQMPLCVLNRIRDHYMHEHANVHRGFHELSRRSTDALEASRETIKKLTGVSESGQIVFTSGATASVNMAACMLEQMVGSGDEILVTQMEHHSDFLPWQQMAKKTGAELKIAKIQEDGTLDMDHFSALVSGKTRIVAVTQMSNVSGIANPVSEISRVVREKTDAVLLIDGAQGIVHLGFAIPECDFYCFSGHKLGAPVGIGVLYMSKRMIQNCQPVFFGGGTVYKVTEQEMYLKDGAGRFEAGTPNFVGALGLAEAMRFWNGYDPEKLGLHEDRLLAAFQKKLENYMAQGMICRESLQIIGEKVTKHGCIAFVTPGISAFDFCSMMNQHGVAVRSGHHCAQPYLHALGLETAVRVSVAPYNTMEEMEKTAEYVVQTIQFFERMKHRDNGEHARCRRGYHKGSERTG